MVPVIILPGPPGAGKGTPARMLEEDFGVVPLSAGGPLRAAVAAGTEAGKHAKAAMDAGQLASDETALKILKYRMAVSEFEHRIVPDGVPGTAWQAEALDCLPAKRKQWGTAAIGPEFDDEAMVARVSGRFACASCGEGYHDEVKQPATAEVCDKCGGMSFKRRTGDNAERVRARLAAYHAETAPPIANYDRLSVLEQVPAMGSIASIRARLAETVGRVAV